MDNLKAGLDLRAYDFQSIDAETWPLWRSHNCKLHGGGYEDIVSCIETTFNVERMLRSCCLEPYNDAARGRIAYWTKAKDTDEGKALLKQGDEIAASVRVSQIRDGR
jgi:hypothetical protein